MKSMKKRFYEKGTHSSIDFSCVHLVYFIEKEPEPKKLTLVERGIVTKVVPDKEPTKVEKSWIKLKDELYKAFLSPFIAVDKAVFGDLFGNPDEKNLRPEKRR